jgi:hypothetical protein
LLLVTLGSLDRLTAAQNPAAAPVGAWKTMPDLVGVRLHMPLDLAVAAVRAQYPKSPFQTWLHNPLPINGPQKQITGGVSINYGGGGFADQVNIDVTELPNAQVVWHVETGRAAERHRSPATSLAHRARQSPSPVPVP